MTDKQLNRAFFDVYGEVQEVVFGRYAVYVSDRFRDEQLNHALFEPNGQVREFILGSLIQYDPSCLRDDHIERALFTENGEVNESIFDCLIEFAPARLTDVQIERALFTEGQINLDIFDVFPYAKREHLDVDYWAGLPAQEFHQLDGYIFSALPDNVLGCINADVLNNLTADNKAKLGMRVLAKLSDEAFEALDRSVLGHKNIVLAFSTNPQAFFEMPEWRQQRIIESRVL